MPNGNDQNESLLADGIYCYTQPANNPKGQSRYHTVFVGPLLRVYLDPEPGIIESQLGGHIFRALTDKAMYLIPYNDPYAEKYSLENMTYTLKHNPDEADRITIPMEFQIAVSRFFHYKMEAGKLYKKHQHKWLLQEV
jgi:hypothetical protein